MIIHISEMSLIALGILFNYYLLENFKLDKKLNAGFFVSRVQILYSKIGRHIIANKITNQLKTSQIIHHLLLVILLPILCFIAHSFFKLSTALSNSAEVQHLRSYLLNRHCLTVVHLQQPADHYIIQLVNAFKNLYVITIHLLYHHIKHFRLFFHRI